MIPNARLGASTGSAVQVPAVAKPHRRRRHRPPVETGLPGTTRLDSGSHIDYYPDFLPKSVSNALLREQKAEPHWSYREIVMFGRPVREPRQKVLYGSHAYKYSGSQLHPVGGFPSQVRRVASLVEQALELPAGWFNTCLGNMYADGSEYMGPHRDNEKELDEKMIASISVGAERRFVVKSTEDGAVHEWTLGHGSLLVMRGEMMQVRWKHSLPKDSKCEDVRVNLTYRRILT